jgi:hypothetical protein
MQKQPIKNTPGKQLLKQLSQPVKDIVTIPIRVKTNFYNGDKTLMNDIYKKDFNYFLFGEYDRIGGYSIARYMLPESNNNRIDLSSSNKQFIPQGDLLNHVTFTGTIVTGVGEVAQQRDFVNIPLKGILNKHYMPQPVGSIMDVYVTSKDNWASVVPVAPDPNNIYVIVESDSTSYASLCASTSRYPIEVTEIQMVTDNPLQYLQTIKILTHNQFGKPIVNNLNPASYVGMQTTTTQTVVMPVNFLINEFTGLASVIKFNTSFIEFTFKCRIIKQPNNIYSNIR